VQERLGILARIRDVCLEADAANRKEPVVPYGLDVGPKMAV
jgi:hypothetical protein